MFMLVLEFESVLLSESISMSVSVLLADMVDVWLSFVS